MPFTIVEFPVCAQPWRLGINVVHILVDFLLRTYHIPNAYFADFTVEHAHKSDRINAIGVTYFEMVALTCDLFAQIDGFTIAVVFDIALQLTVHIDGCGFSLCVVGYSYVIPLTRL